MGAEGPITHSAFDTYSETQLAPTLVKGDVVILDNSSVHKNEKAAQCSEATRRLVPVPAALIISIRHEPSGVSVAA